MSNKLQAATRVELVPNERSPWSRFERANESKKWGTLSGSPFLFLQLFG